MKNSNQTYFALTLALASGGLQALNASPAPILVNAPKAMEEDFSTAKAGKAWVAAKGTWEVLEGALKGIEKESDNHAAVMTLRAPHTDSAVSFRFQLAGSKGFSLSYNHPKGHLFRVNFTGANIQIRTDKDKNDPASKSELIAQSATKLKQGQWYTVLCETKGDKVALQIAGVKVEGSHAALAQPKTGYRFVLKGEGVMFDDVNVWKAK